MSASADGSSGAPASVDSSVQPSPQVDPPLSLEAQNEQLRRENEALRRRLDEERSLRGSLDASGSHHALESQQYREKIEAKDDKADILALYDELQQLRQTCAVYAEAIEESRGYFFELKRLYAELEAHLRPEGSRASKGSPV